MAVGGQRRHDANRSKVSFRVEVIPEPFLPTGIRNVTWDDDWTANLPAGAISVAWSRMFWNNSNPALAERYAPLFRTDLALPIGVVNLRNVRWSRGVPRLFALLFWRIQAHNMEPREGIVEVCSPRGSVGTSLASLHQIKGSKTHSLLSSRELTSRAGH